VMSVMSSSGPHSHTWDNSPTRSKSRLRWSIWKPDLFQYTPVSGYQSSMSKVVGGVPGGRLPCAAANGSPKRQLNVVGLPTMLLDWPGSAHSKYLCFGLTHERSGLEARRKTCPCWK